MDRLIEYRWPGNIRALQNVIEHSAILSDGTLLRVPPVLLSTCVIAGATPTSSLSHAIESGERRLIEQALEKTTAARSDRRAATRLGIQSSTLESKIKRLRINKHQYRASGACSRHARAKKRMSGPGCRNRSTRAPTRSWERKEARC
jgi:formate hydrogenlyase transcriptional activator